MSWTPTHAATFFLMLRRTRVNDRRPSLQDRGTPELKRTRSQPGQPCHAEESR